MVQFRFVHVGVATALVAASLTVVGLVREVRATSTGAASAFVPIVPCRLADTRAGVNNVGTRATPLGPGESAAFAVWGVNGNCTIPNTATGIATNVTAVGPDADSYLTVYPADANPRPTASNINVTSTSPPTANQVTVALAASGAIAVYNNNGNVNIVIDIVGYYVPITSPSPTPGPPGPPGPSGVTPQNVIWVAKSGGQFTSLSAAMNSINDSNPHLIMIAPGTYVETAPVVLKTNVDIQGSGQDRTTITCACALTNSVIGQESTIFANGNISAEIRNITITNSGGPAHASYAVELDSVTAAMSLVDTTMTAANSTIGADAGALAIVDSELPHIDRINTYTATASYNIGVVVIGSGHVIIRNSWLYTSGAGTSFHGNGLSRLATSTVNGNTVNMSGDCDLVLTVVNTPYTCV